MKKPKKPYWIENEDKKTPLKLVVNNLLLEVTRAFLDKKGQLITTIKFHQVKKDDFTSAKFNLYDIKVRKSTAGMVAEELNEEKSTILVTIKQLLKRHHDVLDHFECASDGSDVSDDIKLNRKKIKKHIPLLSNPVVRIHPAVSFADNDVYFGVVIPSEDEDGKVSNRPYLISNKGLIDCDNTDGYYTPNIDNTVFEAEPCVSFNNRITIKSINDLITMKKKYFFRSLFLENDVTNVTKFTNFKEITKKIKKDLTKIDIFGILRSLYNNYIEFTDERYCDILALWDIGTYFFPLFNSYPYIAIYGKKNSGKTKVMTLSSMTSFNGRLSVGISPAALYRGTQSMRWTLYFDEAMSFKRSGSNKRVDELMPMVLNGYKKGAVVPRAGSSDSNFKIELYDVYSPKMFAGTEKLDDILSSRAIPITMLRTMEGDPRGESYIDESLPMWNDLRESIYAMLLTDFSKIRATYQSLENKWKLSNRDWEISKPLIAIAQFIDHKNKTGLVDKVAGFLEETFASRKIKDADDDADFFVIQEIWNMKIWNEYIPLSKIVSAVRSRFDYDDIPKWVNNRWVSKILEKFDMVSDSRKMAHGSEKMFIEDKIRSLMLRYGIEFDELKETEETQKKIGDD